MEQQGRLCRLRPRPPARQHTSLKAAAGPKAGLHSSWLLPASLQRLLNRIINCDLRRFTPMLENLINSLFRFLFIDSRERSIVLLFH